LLFEYNSWHIKVRDDKLNEASEDDDIRSLVQKRLKADSGMYPLSAGEFDRWVERFTKRLEKYAEKGY
jgi:hypothetical protein